MKNTKVVTIAVERICMKLQDCWNLCCIWSDFQPLIAIETSLINKQLQKVIKAEQNYCTLTR